MKRSSKLALTLAAIGVATFATAPAAAIDRGEVMARAKAFALHPWTATQANMTATCSAAYESVYVVGDFVGLPYDWGGYMTLFQFDQKILAGQGAGSYPADGIRDCTAGVDCSGFVSQAWQTGHYTTSSLDQISSAIDVASMLPGDVFNDAGYHVAMLDHVLADGAPIFVESVGYNVHYNATGGWAYVNGFIPRRFQSITGTSAAEPVGTPFNPIVVSSFPYSDSRNTAQSGSDLLDGCGASPGTNESGREYVYEVTFTQPGQLTATVSDDAGVDIDVHVYTSTNTSDCFARHDTTVTVNVDCGRYLVVADTFKGSSGEQPGAYTLSLAFTPSGAACGNGPEGYAPEGVLGDACAFPGNEDLPFCNPNLGAEVCLYGDSSSFCSKPCATAADCAAFAGGCCSDIGSGELYCLTSDFCAGEPPPEEEEPPPAGDPPQEELPTSAASGGGADGSSGAGAADGNGKDNGGAGEDETSSEEGGCSAAGKSSTGWLAAVLWVGLLSRRRRSASRQRPS